MSQKEMDDLYARLDENHDGWVDVAEVRSFLTKFESVVKREVEVHTKAKDSRRQVAAKHRFRASLLAAALLAEVKVMQQEER